MQQSLTVSAGTSTTQPFALTKGSGCPTCTDLCSGVACPNTICVNGNNPQLWNGTCNGGTCSNETAPAGSACPLGSSCVAGSECNSGYCGYNHTCVGSCDSSEVYVGNSSSDCSACCAGIPCNPSGNSWYCDYSG
jgi:hypothetical protein